MSTPLCQLSCIMLGGTVYSDVLVCVDEYANGGTALKLVGKTGEPIATATSWIEGLQEGELAIKDYSENHGIFDQLLMFGVIQPAHRYLRSGFIQFPVTRLAEPGGIPGTIQEQEMQQKAVAEFIREQLGTEDETELDLGDFINEDDVDELLETGSIELDLNDDITIRVITSVELVAKQPASEGDEKATDF